MTVNHHPEEALLLDYATGAMNEPTALIVATHLALCPQCRRDVEAMEAVGGVMLQQADKDSLSPGSFDALMNSIDALPCEAADSGNNGPCDHAVPPPMFASYPRPLRDRLQSARGDLPWKRRGAIETHFLPTEEAGHRIWMLRIAPGHGVPQHSHIGTELTLVLQGGFSDETGHFGRGDLQFADDDLDHRPVADHGEPCVCMAVTSAPLRLTGPVGRLLNPFVRI